MAITRQVDVFVTRPQTTNFMTTTIQLRYQNFDIRLEDKPRVGTPIRQNLLYSNKFKLQKCFCHLQSKDTINK